MLARDIMNTNVITASPETSVKELAKLMIDHNITSIPIVDKDNNLLGIVTEGDIVYRVEESKKEFLDAGVVYIGTIKKILKNIDKKVGFTAREVMTEKVHTAREDSKVSWIAHMMVERHVKNIPIVRNNKVVGIVGRRDIMKLVAEDKM